MVNAGDIITLRGKTLKGKNRVREHGDQWRVIKISKGTQWVPVGLLFIEPVRTGKEARWIKPRTDPNFEIAEPPANQ